MKNKIKTHKASAKRFRVTPKGKLLHNKQGDNAHLRIKKGRARKDRLGGQSALASTNEATKIKKLIINY